MRVGSAAALIVVPSPRHEGLRQKSTSPNTVRRVYNNWRNACIAEAERPSGEIIGDLRVMQGGAIPVEFQEWVVSQADYLTLSSLQATRNLLLFGQAISNAHVVEVPTCAMLYEPQVAPAMVAQLSRYLVREGVIPKARYTLAFEALLRLFAGTDDDGVSFRDRCRHAFWSSFRRFDPEAVSDIESRMSALNKPIV